MSGLTYAQLVSLATQDAKCPSFTSQAGLLLNAVLQELAQDYDLEITRGTYYFNFNPGLIAPVGNSIFGSGPYPLPADYLRADPNDVFWTLQGVPYTMINIDLSEFDRAVQQAGMQSYPYWYATDLGLADETAEGGSTPQMYVYPPPSGAYPVTVRYHRQMPDVATPETSSSVPWFPNSLYLRRRLAGELMLLTGDDRATGVLGEGPNPPPGSAAALLSKYLKMEGDKQARAQTIKLDRRRFGPRFSALPDTKLIGW